MGLLSRRQTSSVQRMSAWQYPPGSSSVPFRLPRAPSSAWNSLFRPNLPAQTQTFQALYCSIYRHKPMNSGVSSTNADLS